jgi:hypothetical protein
VCTGGHQEHESKGRAHAIAQLSLSLSLSPPPNRHCLKLRTAVLHAAEEAAAVASKPPANCNKQAARGPKSQKKQRDNYKNTTEYRFWMFTSPPGTHSLCFQGLAPQPAFRAGNSEEGTHRARGCRNHVGEGVCFERKELWTGFA